MRYKCVLRAAAAAVPIMLVAMSATAQAQSTGSRAIAGIPDTASNSARRISAVRSAQAAVLAQMTQTHARNVQSISLVNVLAATISPGEAKVLAANPAVSEVVPDLPVPVAGALPAVSAPPPPITTAGPRAGGAKAGGPKAGGRRRVPARRRARSSSTRRRSRPSMLPASRAEETRLSSSGSRGLG